MLSYSKKAAVFAVCLLFLFVSQLTVMVFFREN